MNTNTSMMFNFGRTILFNTSDFKSVLRLRYSFYTGQSYIFNTSTDVSYSFSII